MKTDVNGHRYAKLDDLKPGYNVEVDGGFTCMDADVIKIVHSHENGLYIDCEEGRHFLNGQDDGDGYCVGIYKL